MSWSSTSISVLYSLHEIKWWFLLENQGILKSWHTILQVIGIYSNYCLLRNHWIISKTLRWSFLKCMYCEYVVYFSLQMWDGALYVIMLWIVCCLFPFSEVSWLFYLSMLSISLQMCDGGFYVSMLSIVRCLYLICK